MTSLLEAWYARLERGCSESDAERIDALLARVEEIKLCRIQRLNICPSGESVSAAVSCDPEISS